MIFGGLCLLESPRECKELEFDGSLVEDRRTLSLILSQQDEVTRKHAWVVLRNV